jgi:hypothetical protein
MISVLLTGRTILIHSTCGVGRILSGLDLDSALWLALKFYSSGASGSVSTTCCNKPKHCILHTEGICVFRMVLTINSDCFSKQH